ncbi:hypothetical protein OIU84_030041 [Salix udensis]|uniref:Uncharacterized protein n=1 Tax=Salix udensis TaxID=889485 RepID=A0AAD6KAL9_9ROSI|nr:hypothetical protein OIU84_030041 [Salix udensis]
MMTHTTHQRWDENGSLKQKGDQVAGKEDGVPTGGVSKVTNAEGKPSLRTEGQGSEEEEVRLLKGKAKVDSLPLGTVNETTSLVSKSFSLNEEESSGTNTVDECSANSRDKSPTAFTKVRKKKGGKKQKEAYRL